MAMDSINIEIHPAVDAGVINSKKREQQVAQARREARALLRAAERVRCLKRFKETRNRMLWKVVAVLFVVAVLSIVAGLDLMSTGLVSFLSAGATYWLAIQFGAWLQYVFCERGFMK